MKVQIFSVFLIIIFVNFGKFHIPYVEEFAILAEHTQGRARKKNLEIQIKIKSTQLKYMYVLASIHDDTQAFIRHLTVSFLDVVIMSDW